MKNCIHDTKRSRTQSKSLLLLRISIPVLVGEESAALGHFFGQVDNKESKNKHCSIAV